MQIRDTLFSAAQIVTSLLDHQDHQLNRKIQEIARLFIYRADCSAKK
ncbi:MAG: hypothetical protein ACOYK9_05625 [Chlamydiia bacterium]